MSARVGQPAFVDAVADVTASAGLKSVDQVQDSSIGDGLSGISRGFVWGANFAAMQLGSGADASTVLAAASSYVVTMLQSGVQAAAQVGVEAAASALESIPAMGAIVQFAVDFALSVSEGAVGVIGGGDWAANASKCAKVLYEPRDGLTGTGAFGHVLPCDVFMGRAVNSQGNLRRDAFWTPTASGWVEKRRPFSDGAMGALLRELENPQPYDPTPSNGTPVPDVSDVWPGSKGWRVAAVLSGYRNALRGLRLGISAQYADTARVPPLLWTPGQLTDGGAGLWTVYLDLLDQLERKKLISRDYLTWRNLLRVGPNQGGYYENQKFLADKFLRACRGEYGAAAKAEPLDFVRDTWGGAVQDAGPVCALFDRSTPTAIVALATGWRSFVQSPYSQYKAQLDALGFGPPPAPTTGWDVLKGAAVFAALGGAAYYAVDPAAATRLAGRGGQLARDLGRRAGDAGQKVVKGANDLARRATRLGKGG